MEWYYALGDQQHGPVPLGEVLMLAQQGIIHNDTLVWNMGMKDWTPANQTELASLFNEQKGMEMGKDGDYWGMGEKSFCVAMHLAQFSGCIIPFGNIILPLIMWLMNREKNARIDRHGKIILNWQISMILYVIISAILSVVIIGIPLLLVLLIMSIVYPIMGAVKANKEEVFNYSGSISFLGKD